MTIPFLALIILAVLFSIFAPKIGGGKWDIKRIAILGAIVVLLLYIIAGGTITEVIVK